MAEMSKYKSFSAKKTPNVVRVEHWEIQHAIFNVLFCSVFSSNVLSDYFWDKLFIVPCRICTAFVGSSYHVFNWCRIDKL